MVRTTDIFDFRVLQMFDSINVLFSKFFTGVTNTDQSNYPHFAYAHAR